MKNLPKPSKARLALIAAAVVLVVLGFLTLKQTPDLHEYDYVAKQKSGALMLTAAITSTSLVWMGSYTLWLLALCCIPMTRKEETCHA